MSWTSGEKLSQSRLRRLSETIPSTYTIWKDGSTYRAETNMSGGTDYNGTNASIVIQAAIDTLTTTGGLIFLKEGHYSISTALNMLSDVTVKGATNGATVLEATGSVTIFKNKNQASGDTFTDFDIQLDDMTLNADSGDHGVHFVNVQGFKLERIIFKGGGSTHRAVELDGCEMGEINGCQTVGSGIAVLCPSPKTPRASIIISDNELGGGAACDHPGLLVDRAYRIIASNNMINYHGLSSELIFQNSANGIIISGNHIFDGGYHGISIDGCRFIQIIGNDIIDNSQNALGTYDGVKLSGDSQDILIKDNIIRNINFASHKYAIEEAGTSNRNIFSENSVVSVTTPYIVKIGALTVVKNNIGHVTENSGTSTGTGAQQTIAHGIGPGLTPNHITLTNTDDGANPYESAAADATNIYVTAVNLKKYTWEVNFI